MFELLKTSHGRQSTCIRYIVFSLNIRGLGRMFHFIRQNNKYLLIQFMQMKSRILIINNGSIEFSDLLPDSYKRGVFVK